MSVLLDIIRYYTVEKNSEDIGKIICLRLSQHLMYDTEYFQYYKIIFDAAINLSNYYISVIHYFCIHSL